LDVNWLITGGCGFVGSNLAYSLLQDGEEVTVLDNLSRHGSEKNLVWLQSTQNKNFKYIQGDTRNAEGIAEIIKNLQPDAIAQLAGQVAMTTSIENPRLDYEVNSGGTFNVLDAVRRFSPKTIVLFSSSNKVYGSLSQIRVQEQDTRYILPDFPNGLDENTALQAHSPYGCSKLSADQYVQDFHRMYGLNTVVFRHSSMYGGRQFATFDQGWVGWFCQKAIEAEKPGAQPFSINGNGKQVRDVLYTDDLIAVYKLAAANIEKTTGKVYNIGGGMENSLSLLELFKMLEEMDHVHLSFYPLDWRAGDQKVFVADNTLAGHDFGWQPKVDKFTGVKKTLEWCKGI
jgi:CDP-paratose 2-epimerase